VPFEELIATVTAVVARSIAEAIRRHVRPRHDPSLLIVSGGGAFNPTLLEMLALALKGTRVERSEDHGIPSDAREALAFALLGNETLSGLPANVPVATGARHPVILGKITPA
jgi:anhydro-N-acetylmuramic acid kinase